MGFFTLMIIMTFSIASSTYYSEICWTSVTICSENSGDEDGYYVTIEVNGDYKETSSTFASSSIGSTGYTVTCPNCCYTTGQLSSTPSIEISVWDDEYVGDYVLWSVSPSGNAGSWHLDGTEYTSCTERFYYDVTDLDSTTTSYPTSSSVESLEYDELELVGTSEYIALGTSYEGCKTACEQNTDCNYLSYGEICYSTDERDTNDCNTVDMCRVYTTYTDSFYNSNVRSISYNGALPTADPTKSPTPRPTYPTPYPTYPTPYPTYPTPYPTYPTPYPTYTTPYPTYTTPYPTSRPTSSDTGNSDNASNGSTSTILIVVIVVVAILLFVIFLALWFKYKKQKQAVIETMVQLNDNNQH